MAVLRQVSPHRFSIAARAIAITRVLAGKPDNSSEIYNEIIALHHLLAALGIRNHCDEMRHDSRFGTPHAATPLPRHSLEIMADKALTHPPFSSEVIVAARDLMAVPTSEGCPDISALANEIATNQDFDFIDKSWPSSSMASKIFAILSSPPDTRTIDHGDDPDAAVILLWYILRLKSPHTAVHCQRVTRLAMALSAEGGLTTGQRDTLARAALLHDVGKITLPEALLSKAGNLTFEEREELRTHADTGRSIVKCIPGLCEEAEIVGRHHEKCDGSGYPQGLGCKDIDLLTRIVTVADVYDALSHARPYRAALPDASVFNILNTEMADQLDSSIVAALREIVVSDHAAPSASD
ncbi:HD-GYP domain-containing protein [Algicella marina]|nr:HD domain-containing phosphohydrolase [Algicella marina]